MSLKMKAVVQGSSLTAVLTQPLDSFLFCLDRFFMFLYKHALSL